MSGRYESVLDDLGNWDVVYQIALIVWIVFGLGYVFMIVGVIAENLKKPARSAARRFRKAEKAMTSKILQEIVIMKTTVGGWKLSMSYTCL